MTGNIHNLLIPRDRKWSQRDRSSDKTQIIELANFRTSPDRPDVTDRDTYWGAIVMFPDQGEGTIGRTIIQAGTNDDPAYIYTINNVLGPDGVGFNDPRSMKARYTRNLGNGSVEVGPANRLIYFTSPAAIVGELSREQCMVQAAISAYRRDRTLGRRAVRSLRALGRRSHRH